MYNGTINERKKEMAEYFAHHSAWVDEDGSYGVGNVIHFDVNDLTEDQWEVVSELGDNSRYDYVYALLNGEDVSEWED
jgi:hypothetical protein